ncbi:hypothetical protein [Pseudolactococcus hodotermopsidis]|nr:hypothetical protein [Lactococcus hodotermopsidis]
MSNLLIAKKRYIATETTFSTATQMLESAMRRFDESKKNQEICRLYFETETLRYSQAIQIYNHLTMQKNTPTHVSTAAQHELDMAKQHYQSAKQAFETAQKTGHTIFNETTKAQTYYDQTKREYDYAKKAYNQLLAERHADNQTDVFETYDENVNLENTNAKLSSLLSLLGKPKISAEQAVEHVADQAIVPMQFAQAVAVAEIEREVKIPENVQIAETQAIPETSKLTELQVTFDDTAESLGNLETSKTATKTDKKPELRTTPNVIGHISWGFSASH